MFIFFIDPATTEIYTLSLHDALPIYPLGIIDAELDQLLSLVGGLNQVTTPPAGLSLDSGDRKSTRLNSSHVEISYAVFCLKKKNKFDINNTIDSRPEGYAK